MVPLCVSVGDMDGRDLQINMEEFYGRIGKGEIPRSSQPPIGDVVEVYEKYQDADVLNICVADGLSGTYHGALSARIWWKTGTGSPCSTAGPFAAPTGIWWKRPRR